MEASGAKASPADGRPKAPGLSGPAREIVTQEIIQALIKSPNLPLDVSVNTVDIFVYELIWAVIESSIPADLVPSILEAHSLEGVDYDSVVCDALWLVSSEVLHEDTKMRETLIATARELRKEHVIYDKTLRETCEFDFLEEIGALPSRSTDQLNKKAIKLNTTMKYAQIRFNLLREESEGYAKLIVVVNAEYLPTNIVRRKIQALIGYFDLDPNKCLAIILDSMEVNSQAKERYLGLISDFHSPSVCPIVGFKFLGYQSEEKSVGKPRFPPDSLFQLTAILIKEGFFTKEKIYPYFEDLAKEREKRQKEMALGMGEVKKLGIANLAGLAVEKTAEQRAKEEKDAKTHREALINASESLETSYRIKLATALLRLGKIEDSLSILNDMETMDPFAERSLQVTAVNIIKAEVDKVYQRCSPFRTEDSDPLPLFDEQHLSLLYKLGYHLGSYPIIYAKLCRILSVFIIKGQSKRKAMVMKTLETAILPALCILGHENYAAAMECNAVVKLLNYHERYRLYGKWKTANSNCPKIEYMRRLGIEGAKRAMRRITKDRESRKQAARIFCKATHGNPGVVLNEVLNQLESYSNMIEPVVVCMSQMTELTFDVISYEIVSRLSNPTRNKIKDDGQNIANWMDSMATFCGMLWKRYPTTELQGLMQYIINKLKDEQSVDLLILRELLKYMCNIENVEDMSDRSLMALAGGEILQQVTQQITSGAERSSRGVTKGMDCLKGVLLPGGRANEFAVPLLVLIAQQRSHIIYREEQSHLKLIGDLFDRCHETLFQYCRFLRQACGSLDDFAKLMPSLKELVTNYHLDIEIAVHLYRPILEEVYLTSRGIKNVHSPEISDELKQSAMRKWEQYMSDMKSILPARLWDAGLSVDFYLTFWALSLSHLTCPEKLYEEEIRRHEDICRRCQDIISGRLKPDDLGMGSGQDDHKTLRARINDTTTVISSLRKELQEQKEQQLAVWNAFKIAEKQWSKEASQERNRKQRTHDFTSSCIQLRLRLSNGDALYCAEFIRRVHQLSTECCHTMIILDRVSNVSKNILFALSNYEASRVGRFLCNVYALFHSFCNPKVFEEQCRDNIGMSHTVELGPGSQTNIATIRKVILALKRKLFNEAYRISLENMKEPVDYIHIRNILLVITKLKEYFPDCASISDRLKWEGENKGKDVETQSLWDNNYAWALPLNQIRGLMRTIGWMKDNDTREDLKVMARRYYGMLEKMMADLYKEEDRYDLKGFLDSALDKYQQERRMEKRKDDNKPESKEKLSHENPASASHDAGNDHPSAAATAVVTLQEAEKKPMQVDEKNLGNKDDRDKESNVSNNRRRNREKAGGNNTRGTEEEANKRRRVQQQQQQQHSSSDPAAEPVPATSPSRRVAERDIQARKVKDGSESDHRAPRRRGSTR